MFAYFNDGGVKGGEGLDCCRLKDTAICAGAEKVGCYGATSDQAKANVCAKDDTCAKMERDCVSDCCTSGSQEGCSFGNSKPSACADKSYCTEAGKPSHNVKVQCDTSCCFNSCGTQGPSKDSCCDDSASCGRKEALSLGRLEEHVNARIDIEKDVSILEHVALDVQGLTCVGCETKLFRALRDIRGVCNLQTSLLLSKAEFDLDEKAGPVDKVIKSVERSTGFACRRLSNEGQKLDVLVDGDAEKFIEGKYPEGITQMDVIDKRTVRITFDPNIVGSRAVVANLFGTQSKLAAPRTSSDLESGQKHVRHTARVTLVSAILTVPVLVLAWAPLTPRPMAYNAASLALATAVQFVIAGQFYVSALKALIYTHVVEMDLLIVLSTSTAYIFSVVSFAYQVIDRPLPTGQFFETSTLLVTLIMLGRLVSAFARQRAVESVSIRSLQMETAVICDAWGRNEQEIDARLLQYGDLFKVAPDSRVPTDGVIVTGSTEIDESMVTGESLPVEKHPGSSVVAGSINGSGVVVVRLTHLPSHNTISTIAAMVDEAKLQKPKTQELVDIVASYFVPVILVLTFITFVIWIAVGVGVRHQGGGTAVVNAITYGVSVLIVSCPCAIGLCVPMVIVIAGGAAAKHGVVLKSTIALESAHKVSHVVFDKTGTLTEGELSVAEEVILAERQLALSVTLGLTSNSKHPVSAAMSAYLKAKGVEIANVQEVNSVTGKGIKGIYAGEVVRCGNLRWLSLHNLPEAQNLLGKGLTVLGVVVNGRPLAIFGLSDSIRRDTKSVLAELEKRKITVSIVSGDDTGATEGLAAKLGIPGSHVRSRCSPAEKQEYLKDLVTDGNDTVIFCGDGTNDAVALAQADIGVHMSSGSEVAQTAADVVLVRPHIGGILVMLDLSRAAMHRVFLNFAWSFVYNLFCYTFGWRGLCGRAHSTPVCWAWRDCQRSPCYTGCVTVEVVQAQVLRS